MMAEDLDGAEQTFDWEINWECWLLICSTNYGLITPSSPSFCHTFSEKYCFEKTSKEKSLQTRSEGLLYGHLLTGWTPVGPYNQVPDPQSALKDFMVQIHQQSYHNSVKHYVWLPYKQKLQASWFPGLMWKTIALGAKEYCHSIMVTPGHTIHMGHFNWAMSVKSPQCRQVSEVLRWLFLLLVLKYAMFLSNNCVTWRWMAGLLQGWNQPEVSCW